MTLQELSSKTFHSMQNYSQLIIDLVDVAEQDLETLTPEEKQAEIYTLTNLLKVIDPLKKEDIEAINILITEYSK